MNKKSLTETDIRTKFITPALIGAGGAKWDVMTQIREEAYFTKGRVIVRGRNRKAGAPLPRELSSCLPSIEDIETELAGSVGKESKP